MSITETVYPLGIGGRQWKFKIAGGLNTEITSMPFQGYLVEGSSPNIMCGATILSSLVILTAAHCLVNKTASSLTFVAGDKQISIQEETEQRIRLSHFHLYEKFSSRSPDNDIAVGVLSSKLSFNQHVSSISFPTEPRSYNGVVTISGWGKANDNDDHYQDILQSAKLPIVSVANCTKLWRGDLKVKDTFICAYKAGTDTCYGDSGGPLTGRHNGENKVIGVIAAGPDCDMTSRRPGFYINVSRFGTWILLKMIETGENPTKCNDKDKFWCTSSSKCIRRSYVCDGDNDCGNNEDEANCKICQKGKFRCESSNACIPASSWCNGVRDCPNGEDETPGCSTSCPNGGYRCNRDKRCIPHWAKCNMRGDCDGDDDEDNCPSSPTYKCNGGESIPINWKCDGTNDCPQGDDETGCPYKCNVSCRPYQNNEYNEAVSACCISAGYTKGHCNPGDIAVCSK